MSPVLIFISKMESGALCLEPFQTSSRKYRKLLYGKSCATEIGILNGLISATWPGLSVGSCVKKKPAYAQLWQRNSLP